MIDSLIISVLIFNILSISCVESQPVVQTHEGKLQGIIQQTPTGRNFASFLGIPYAKPPIDDLRFKNPVLSDSWNGVRMANIEGNICPQLDNTKLLGHEDCLYLNVHTPITKFNLLMLNNTSANNLLPVMVWIHGGTFVTGSGNMDLFNPSYLLEKNVIFVSMNYRLGILGFLSTGNQVAPGNFGLKDQVLALKWVQRNIRAFGGDPKRVTLFGESAGGASVSLHTYSQVSEGLFHQYIVQSGSAIDPWAYQPRAYFDRFIKELAAIVHCPHNNSSALIDCLRDRSVVNLLETSSIFGTVARFAQLTWTPTDEPESNDAFLTDNPRNILAQGKVRDYPHITGNVASEGLLVTEIFYTNSGLYVLLKSFFHVFVEYICQYYLRPSNVDAFIEDVRKFYWKNESFFSDKKEFLNGVTKFITDGFFLYPTLTEIEKIIQRNKNPAYLYNFGYEGYAANPELLSEKVNNKTYEDVMVSHADELQYLFPSRTVKLGGFDAEITDIMIELWTSFAINGKPTSKHIEPDLWKPLNVHFNYLKIAGSSTIKPSLTLENSFFKERMQFWKNHYVI